MEGCSKKGLWTFTFEILEGHQKVDAVSSASKHSEGPITSPHDPQYQYSSATARCIFKVLSHSASRPRRSSLIRFKFPSGIQERQCISRERPTMSLVAPTVVSDLSRCHGVLSGGVSAGNARFTRAHGRLSSHRKAHYLMQSRLGTRPAVTVCSSSHDMASNENDFDLSR